MEEQKKQLIQQRRRNPATESHKHSFTLEQRMAILESAHTLQEDLEETMDEIERIRRLQDPMRIGHDLYDDANTIFMLEEALGIEHGEPVLDNDDSCDSQDELYEHLHDEEENFIALTGSNFHERIYRKAPAITDEATCPQTKLYTNGVEGEARIVVSLKFPQPSVSMLARPSLRVRIEI